MLIFGVGLIWTLAQWGLANIQETPIEFNNATLIFGLMAGAFVTLSNSLLLESLRHIQVSLGATIYRLNTTLVFESEIQGGVYEYQCVSLILDDIHDNNFFC